MSEYRMMAGITVFVLIVLGTLTAAGARYPSLLPQAPAGGWPPRAPTFSNPADSWLQFPQDCSGIDALKCIATLFVLGFFLLVGGMFWIGQMMYWVGQIVWGLMNFDIPAARSNVLLQLVWNGFKYSLIIVLALVLFRLARSIVPFVSGGAES